MADEIKNGGPAFARAAFDSDRTWSSDQEGMALRDYFAAKALGAFLSDSRTIGNISKDARDLGVDARVYVASAAYEFADAMLRAREVSHG